MLQEIGYGRHSLLEAGLMIEQSLFGSKDTNLHVILEQMEEELKPQLKGMSHGQRSELLCRVFYQEYGFSCDWQEHFELSRFMLTDTLRERRGNPQSLAIILLELAERLNIALTGVLFPAQILLRYPQDTEGYKYLDPTSGVELSHHQLDAMLKGVKGLHASLEPHNHLNSSDDEEILADWLRELKNVLVRNDLMEPAVICSDLLIRLNPEDAYDVRDRGFLFQQLNCYKVAANDLREFLSMMPEDPFSDVLQKQIDTLDNTYAVFH